MGSSKDRRRRILADRTLQGRLIFSLIWPVGLCLAVTAALIGVFCSELSAQAEEAGVVLEWMEQHQQKRMEDSSSESAVGPRCSTVGADSVASSHDR